MDGGKILAKIDISKTNTHYFPEITSRRTMLIYPDTANLNAIRDGKINPSLIESLTASRPGIRWVITVTHFDDAVEGDNATFFTLQQVAQGLPDATWILPGMCIPHAETTRFVESFLRTGRAPESGLQVIFPTSDRMFEAYPEYGATIDCRGDNSEFLRALNSRRQEKATFAAFMNFQRRYEEILMSVDGGSRPIFHINDRVDEQWRAIHEHFSILLPEMETNLGDLDTLPDRLTQSSEFVPMVSQELLKEQIRLFVGITKAAASGDRGSWNRLDHARVESNMRFFTAMNPLGLSPTGDKFHIFKMFCAWTRAESLQSLQSDTDLLKRIFEAWINAFLICPGAAVYREVSLQLFKDNRTAYSNSDENDLWHMAALPYVDILFADKRMHAYLNRCSSLPEDLRERCHKNSTFESWVNSGLRGQHPPYRMRTF